MSKKNAAVSATTIAVLAAITPAVSTETIATVAAVVKAPSKKSLAQVIFDAKIVEKTQGLYASNKDFRAATLVAIETGVGVSRASASTMYNSFKAESEKAGTVVLGRDPKKAKAPSTGVRGRPAGSKNAIKEVVAVVVAADATATEPAAADAATV